MGIVSFLHPPMRSIFLAPAQAVAAWFVPAQNTTSLLAVPAQTRRLPHQLPLPFAQAGSAGQQRTAFSHSVGIEINRNASKFPAISRLKVVREFDSAASLTCAGRMVISGRMADVCAELERMVQYERTHAGLLQP